MNPARISALVVFVSILFAANWCRAKDVEFQPLAAQATRVADAMDQLGSPMAVEHRKTLDTAVKETDQSKGIESIQKVLDQYCLLGVTINPESRVRVARGPAEAQLMEGGWRTFLVKVTNEAGVSSAINVKSPNVGRLANSDAKLVPHLWLDLLQHTAQPLKPELSGLGIEYRVISLYTQETGKREAKISVDVGQGTQDLGFRGEQDILFSIQPAVDVKLNVLDEEGQPTTACFVIRDEAKRVYPSQAKRLAPDFAFHPQIYRADGESIKLPPGKYNVEVTRGPEYLALQRTIEVPAGAKHSEKFALKRWFDPAALGWYSGDHHIHAAGCQHYNKPTEGVHAVDMIRQTVGEDLKIGCNLTWGPCFDYQKQFFTGKDDVVSKKDYLLRYDVEVSGFGSHQSGHLCLLLLKDMMYPGGDSFRHWPTLGLNTLKWAKAQGAITGPAHSGNGINVKDGMLPSYTVVDYNGIGANEFIVDITHMVPGPDGKPVPAIDFISTVDTEPKAELNMWYHSLNNGFRIRASGETDFPCITGERVGIGRSYVKLDKAINYGDWCLGIQAGRNYVSEGHSHILDMKFNDAAMGVNGSELKLSKAGSGKLTAKVAAYLPEKPENLKAIGYNIPWHLEKARITGTRDVKIEAIVNGKPVAEKTITADGKAQDISFDDIKIDKSSWVALRIFPSSHTNPIFVIVDGQPIRASKMSAQWALDGVDQCWKSKQKTYAAREMDDAKAAYDHAREVYKKILSESKAD